MDNIKITVSQLIKDLECRLNTLVLGPSGHGKTAAVETYAKNTGLKIVYVDCCAEMPESIGGIPVVLNIKEEDNAYFRRMLNHELKEFFDVKGEGYILLFDEINQGSPEVLNTLYSITHPIPEMRRWAGHDISKCQIVACGNLSDGRDGVVYLNELPTPLLNRFFKFELEPDSKGAKKYLKAKYKNLANVEEYIDIMLENNISPRDIDLSLQVIENNFPIRYLEAKVGSVVAAKIYDIKDKIAALDPAKTFKYAKATYEKFQENGRLKWDESTIITSIEELKDKWKSFGLTEEEITSILK